MNKLQYIKQLVTKTRSRAVKWKSLSSYRVHNRALEDHISNNVFGKTFRPGSRYRPYFENFHLNIDKSYYAPFKEGYLYLFFYYRPSQYRPTFADKFEASDDTGWTLGIQASLTSEIQEINTRDEYQVPLQALVMYIRENPNLTKEDSDFLKSLFED